MAISSATAADLDLVEGVRGVLAGHLEGDPGDLRLSPIPGGASRVISAEFTFASTTFSLKPPACPTRIPADCAIPSMISEAGITGRAA